MVRVLVTGGSGFVGSHLLSKLLLDGHDTLSIDVRPPQIPGHIPFWRRCDIKNEAETRRVFATFLPTHVIHLAAKANLNGTSVADFPDNTTGTANIISCVNHTASVQVFLNTSTQYVVKPGILPDNEAQLLPYTAYGESKAEAERLVRGNCRKPWVIIRPTNIWGPLHPFFPYELWRYLQRRYYLHPGYKPIRKYYGYVTNAVNKLLKIVLCEESAHVHGGVYYLTDQAIDSVDWMNGFSLALTGKPVHRIPLSLWCLLAKVGDLFSVFGIRFPMSSERLFRLTVNENIPQEWMIPLPEHEVISLKEGIQRSVEWYLAQGSKSSVMSDRTRR